MDRTMIGPWKAEEKELGERLYKKLQGLTLLYPPTEEFAKCLKEDMFLKSNPQAFIHVMHFLFRLLDPAEFRKRFYWPITDKRAEANFRSSTVEYLKHLNDKYHQNWSNIKSYLVVMPGGIKFINFLLEFVSFVVQELIRQREKQIRSEMGEEIPLKNLKHLQCGNQFFKVYASAYIAEVDDHMVKLREKIQRIGEQLTNISHATGLDVTQLKDDEFQAKLENSIKILLRQKFKKRADNIATLEIYVLELKEAIDAFQAKEAEVKYDKDTVRRALQTIFDLYSAENKQEHDTFLKTCIQNDDLTMNCLIEAFNRIHATMEESLDAISHKEHASDFVIKELIALKSKWQDISKQITDFQKHFSMHTKPCNKKTDLSPQTPMQRRVLSGEQIESNLLLKVVATPPIKLEYCESSSLNMRLPLLNDFNNTKPMEKFNNFLAPPRSARKAKNANDPLNESMLNKSKIIDSMQLLRTITKDSSKSKPIPAHNLSLLSTKWKERQCLFGDDINAMPFEKTPQKRDMSCIITKSPVTPFNANSFEHTRIARAQQEVVSSAALCLKRLSAVKKVQDETLNFHNLSTSPSGRLEALMNVAVVVDEIKNPLPKLQINDVTLSSSLSVVVNSPSSALVEKLKTSDKEKLCRGKQKTENDRNVANIKTEFSADLLAYGNEGDELFNISDSVLKDVIL